MSVFFNGTLLVALLFLLTGCFPGRSLVVLLPDEKGNVGEIVVESGDRTVVVDKAYHSTTSVAPFMKPASPKTMTKHEVEEIFAGALAKEPRQPSRFEKRTFYFHLNSVQLTPPSQDILPNTIEYLKSNPPVAIYVVGHADRSGTEYYNRRISHLRAEVMRQALKDGGVEGPIITISYLGESMPAVETPDEVTEPKNRRAELVLQYRRSN